MRCGDDGAAGPVVRASLWDMAFRLRRMEWRSLPSTSLAPMKRFVWILLVATAACDPVGPIENRVVGSMEKAPSGLYPVLVPDSVPSAQPFEVILTTAGGGCMRSGDTETTIEGWVATVTPYDIQLIPPSGTICDSNLTFFEHRALLTFSEPGPVTIVVRARDFNSAAPIELSFSLVVF